MKRLTVVFSLVLLVAGVAVAQEGPSPNRSDNAITHGEAAQLILKIAAGYADEATPDPQTAHELLQAWGIVPVTWPWDDALVHRELSEILARVGIEYLPANADGPVSRVFLEALLWREVTKLRDYYAKRLGHGFSANHVLDAGVDRAVSPSDFD